MADNQIDFNQKIGAGANVQVSLTQLAVYQCPSDNNQQNVPIYNSSFTSPFATVAHGNYVGVQWMEWSSPVNAVRQTHQQSSDSAARPTGAMAPKPCHGMGLATVCPAATASAQDCRRHAYARNTERSPDFGERLCRLGIPNRAGVDHGRTMPAWMAFCNVGCLRGYIVIAIGFTFAGLLIPYVLKLRQDASASRMPTNNEAQGLLPTASAPFTSPTSDCRSRHRDRGRFGA